MSDDGIRDQLDEVYMCLCTEWVLAKIEEEADGIEDDPHTTVTPELNLPDALAKALANTSIKVSRKGGIQNIFDALCSHLLTKGLYALKEEMMNKAFQNLREGDCTCPDCAPELHKDKK